MANIATITLVEQVVDGVFTPDHYLFNITDTTNAVVYTENIAIGTGSVKSLPFTLPDAAYTATAQLMDNTVPPTPRGPGITLAFTLPLPTTTTAQVPSAISIAVA